jgi:hypothetical protein
VTINLAKKKKNVSSQRAWEALPGHVQEDLTKVEAFLLNEFYDRAEKADYIDIAVDVLLALGLHHIHLTER